MKMQEILDIVSKDHHLNKITESTTTGVKGYHKVCLPYSIDDFEFIDSYKAIEIMRGAVQNLQELMGDAVISKYDVPYTTEDTEYIKHYLIGDVPVEIVERYFPGTLRKYGTLLIKYNGIGDDYAIKMVNEAMNIADRIRLFNELLEDNRIDIIVKYHNSSTIVDLITYFQNIAEVSEIDNDVNYIALIPEDTDPTEFAKYTTYETMSLRNNIKALLLSDIGEGKVIKIEKQEK